MQDRDLIEIPLDDRDAKLLPSLSTLFYPWAHSRER